LAGLTPFCGVSDNFVAVLMDAPSLFDDGSVSGMVSRTERSRSVFETAAQLPDSRSMLSRYTLQRAHRMAGFQRARPLAAGGFLS